MTDPLELPIKLARGEAFRVTVEEAIENSRIRREATAEERAEREARANRPAVYFVLLDGPDRPYVKIGFAANPEERLMFLQTSCPYELKLIGYLKTGGVKVEREWHARFASLRCRGEWFRMTEELEDAIHIALGFKAAPPPKRPPMRPLPKRLLAAIVARQALRPAATNEGDGDE